MTKHWKCDNCGADSYDKYTKHLESINKKDLKTRMTTSAILTVETTHKVWFVEGGIVDHREHTEDFCQRCNEAMIDAARTALKKIRDAKKDVMKKEKKKN